CEWLSLRASALVTPGATIGPMVFTPEELEFLRSQRMGRFATVGPAGWPHVTPVMYAVDDAGSLEFDVDGVKLRNLQSERRAAIVVDAMGPKGGAAGRGQGER